MDWERVSSVPPGGGKWGRTPASAAEAAALPCPPSPAYEMGQWGLDSGTVQVRPATFGDFLLWVLRREAETLQLGLVLLSGCGVLMVPWP